MDNRMKEKIKNGTLTRRDIRALIDWQLTLQAEQIDSPLLSECLMALYPQDCVLGHEEKRLLWQRIKAAAFGTSRVHKRTRQAHRRHSARTLMIALLITLLLAGVAIAATLGLFGYFRNDPMIEMSHQRLEYLDEVAVNVGQTQQVIWPAMDLSRIDLTTDYGKILAQQFASTFELAVDQVYCDGNKLYYSYRLYSPQRTFELLEGVPTGFEEAWDWIEEGKRLSDTYWTPGATEEEMAQAKAWFEEHERAYAVETLFGIGDGAALDDGSERGMSLNIFDSGMEEPDAYHEIGFQQVDLPEDYVPGDTISFFLHLNYRTSVVCQDENGVYRTSVANPENRGFIPVRFTAQVTGKPEEFETTAQFDEYTVHVKLAVSDVDISGTATFDAPQEWIDAFEANYTRGADSVWDYELVADGQRMRNVSGGYGYSRWTNQWQVEMRYDLPQSTQNLTLVPRREISGWREDESIVIR